ncbi:MAG: beta-galactosidase [Anaerolineae bacterium]
MIDGEPALIQAGALHYFRLPHPDLWRPVLERMRMGGLNAVVIPFPWAYHAPAPGFHDFTGPRAIDRLLDEVTRVGLWLIPHLGPWIGSGLDAGGVPAWLLHSDVALPRDGDSAGFAHAFLRQVETWWVRLLTYIRDHPNLLFVVLDPGRRPREASSEDPSQALGLALMRLVRRLGVQAPCALPASIWEGSIEAGRASAMGDVPPGDVASRLDQTSPVTSHHGGEPSQPARFLILGEGTPQDGDLSSAEADSFLLLDLDFPATWLGSHRVPVAQALGAEYPRPQIARGVVDGAAAIGLSPYHVGTNWGWWAAPGTVTLHGHGAPVAEGGGLPAHYHQARRISLTLETMGDVLRMPDALSTVSARPAELLLGTCGGRFGTVVFLRNEQKTDSYANLQLERGSRRLTLEDIAVPAESVRVVPLDWRVASRRLVGTTMEPVLRTNVAGRELLVLFNEVGGEVLLPGDFRSRHQRGPVYIERVPFEGARSGLMAHFDPARLGSLVLDGPEGVLQILALAPSLANRVWPLDDLWRTNPIPAPAWRPSAEAPAAGVVIGPDLVVPEKDGGFRFLASDKGFGYRWGPWRGSDPHTWLAPLLWQAPPSVRLPALNWASRPGAPEAQSDYDDRGWRRVVPQGPLSMEAQGVNYGFAWYRAHFSGEPRAVTLTCRHACDLYLNGEHIATLNPPPDLGAVAPKTLPLSSRYLQDQNVLAILVENIGRHESWDLAAQPHGLISCTIEGASGLDWRVRGGLSGEMRVQGFQGYADWDLVPETGAQYVCWHRALFELDLAAAVEIPVFLELEQTPSKAYIYLNHQLIGRMWYPQGAQRRFWLPDGLLERRGTNELLVAQWTRGANPGIGMARLVPGMPSAWHKEAGVQG